LLADEELENEFKKDIQDTLNPANNRRRGGGGRQEKDEFIPTDIVY